MNPSSNANLRRKGVGHPRRLSHGRNGPPQSKELRLEEHVAKVVTLIMDTYKLFGFDSTGYSSSKTIDHWITLCRACPDPESSWMAVAKYKFAAFFADQLGGQQLPKVPWKKDTKDIPGVLLGGRAHRYYRRMRKLAAKGGESRITHDCFLQTVLLLKKGCPRPTKQMLQSAVKKSFATLTTAPKKKSAAGMRWGDLAEDHPKLKVSPLVDWMSVSEQMRRTVHELFGGKVFDMSQVEPFFPSVSANYINTRKAGGCVGALKSEPSLQGHYGHVPHFLQNSSGHSAYKNHPVVPFKRISHSEEEISHISSNEYLFDDTQIFRKFQSFFADVRSLAVKEEPIAKLVPLAEALKVRVISKGPPFTYFTLKPLQKFLWKVLADHPASRLVGEPISAEYIWERLGSKLLPDFEFASGDYSAATDELFSETSNIIVDELIKVLELSPNIAKMLRDSLTGYNIQYDDEHKVCHSARQQRGQLMGSIVSFPILCIANLALCRRAVEVSYQRHFTLIDCPLAINGDDCIFKCNDMGKQFWRDFGSFIGLSESVGKTYFSRRYVNMNSTGFTFDPDHPVLTLFKRDGEDVLRKNPFAMIPFINWSLILGMKRSMAGVAGALKRSDVLATDGSSNQTLGSRSRELLRNCPEHMQSTVLRLFIKKHWTLLTSLKVPWFIPEWAGGVGLPILTQITGGPDLDDMKLVSLPGFGPSRLDLCAMRRILLDWRQRRPESVGDSASWKLHKRLLTMMPERLLREEDAPEQYVRATEQLKNALTFQCFLEGHMRATDDEPESLLDLFDESPSTRAIEALRHNEDLWLKTSKSPMSSPLPLSVCMSVRKYSSYLRVLPCC